MKSHRSKAGAFTLFEVVLALGIFVLLSGAIYGISRAALEAARTTMDEQITVRRVDSFLRVALQTFANLPSEGAVFLRMAQGGGGAPVPELVFEGAPRVFGLPSLAGGSLVLAARPRADGTRTLSLLRVPAGLNPRELDELWRSARWLPLVPGVERVRWTFFSGGEWREEWPQGAGRPLAVRLQMESAGMPGTPIDVQFWIPQLAARPPSPPAPTPPPQ